MSQPILSISEGDKKTKATANLLPCHIHHDGPVDPITSFWNPTKDKDGTREAYFRGRKLHGKTVALPPQHRGVILQRSEPSDQAPPQPGRLASEQDNVTALDEDEEDQGPEVGEMKVCAEFGEMIVWGHERVDGGQEDAYMRGVEEWLDVAKRIHDFGDGENAK